MHRTALMVAGAGGATFAAGLAMPMLASAFERAFGSAPEPAPLTPLPAHPSIDVIVPAYLESTTIGPTVSALHAALAAYPGSSTVTVVASDPDTARVAQGVGADVVVEGERSGKPGAANLAAARSTADILVFTDANCVIEPAEWPALTVEALRSAHLVSAHKEERGAGESAFWRYEKSAKRLTGAAGSIAVVGEFLATRRTDYIPVPGRQISDDLWLSVEYMLRDRVVVISDELRTVEDSAPAAEQWKRRLRICRGLFEELIPRAPELVTRPAGRMFLAHKAFRSTVGSAGFWVAAAGASLVAPPVTVVVLPAAVAVALVYSGRVLPELRLPGPVAAVGMQAVPPVTFGLMLARRLRSTVVHEVGWEKIAR